VIIAAQWRDDGFGQHVLFAGPEPMAQVQRVPGRTQFRSSICSPTGLRYALFPTLEQAKVQTELTVDALVRARLGEVANRVLREAGL
jgi:hypothetical protein